MTIIGPEFFCIEFSIKFMKLNYSLANLNDNKCCKLRDVFFSKKSNKTELLRFSTPNLYILVNLCE